MLHVRYRMLYAAIIAAVAAVLLSACGTSPGASGAASPPPATSAASPSALAGTQWVLTGIEQNGVAQPLVQGTQLTLQFGEGSLGGQAGCNSFSGTYTVDGQTLTVSNLNQTMKACDTAIMQQEYIYT